MRLYLTGALVLGVAAASVEANAGFLKRFFQNSARDFRRNNVWPEPFLRTDRARVREPFAQMVANGWRLQNTLGDHHFNAKTHELTDSGRMQLETILLERPMDHRMVFVLQGRTASDTSARLQSVKTAAEDLLPPGEIAEIAATSVKPAEWKAGDINDTHKSFKANLPEPKLPPRDGQGAGASSGGGN